MPLRFHREALFLSFLLIAGNIVWFQLGDHPQHWDSAIHLSESLNANRIGMKSPASIIDQALNVSWYYPPFVSYVSVPVYRVLGESEFSGLQVMTLFLLLLALSVYGIGNTLFGKEPGLIAASLIIGCPIVLRYSHMFMLDLPLASMVSLSLYLLIRTGFFEQRLPSVFLGFAMGCGILTKWTFPLFLLLPFLYAASGASRSPKVRARRMTNCILAILIGAVIAAPWYLVHAIEIASSRGGVPGGGEATLAESIGYYLRIIPEQVSWILAPFLACGIILVMIKRRSQTALLLLSFVGGYVLLTLIGFKQPRFSIPLLPPLMVLAAAGMVSPIQDSKISGRAKRALMAGLAGLPLIVYVVVSFVPAGSSLGVQLSNPVYSSSIVKVDGPVHADWKQSLIAETIERDRIDRGKNRAVVRVIPDYVYYNNATISCAAKLRHYPIVVMGTTGFPLFTDYVLLKTGDSGEAGGPGDRSRLSDDIISETSTPHGMYRLIGRWNLPDGSEGFLLAVEPKPAERASAGEVPENVRRHAGQFIRRYLKPAGGYSLNVDEVDSGATLAGRVKEITFTADAADAGDFAFNPVGMRVKDVQLSITDVRFDPWKLLDKDTLLLLSIGGLQVKSFTITASDIKRYAEESSAGTIRIDSLSIAHGIIHIGGLSQGTGPSIHLDIRVSPVGHENISFSFESVRIGIVPIPASLANILTSSFNPALKGLDMLPEVTLGKLSLENDRIRIGE
jgi:hypothetical protein